MQWELGGSREKDERERDYYVDHQIDAAPSYDLAICIVLWFLFLLIFGIPTVLWVLSNWEGL